MTLPPCYRPDDEEPSNPSRRTFMLGSAALTAGMIVRPLLGSPAVKDAADPNAIPVSLDVNGTVHALKLTAASSRASGWPCSKRRISTNASAATPT